MLSLKIVAAACIISISVSIPTAHADVRLSEGTSFKLRSDKKKDRHERYREKRQRYERYHESKQRYERFEEKKQPRFDRRGQLNSSQISRILRNRGLATISNPELREYRNVYTANVRDNRGREYRVILDAYRGSVLQAVPVR